MVCTMFLAHRAIGYRSGPWLTAEKARRNSARYHLRTCCSQKPPLEHKPVLLEEVMGFFEGRDLRVLLDCTLGAAGHTSALVHSHAV